MRDWSRANPNKKSSIKPLLIAQQKGMEKAEQELDERRKESEIRNKNYVCQSASNNQGKAARLLLRNDTSYRYDQIYRILLYSRR